MFLTKLFWSHLILRNFTQPVPYLNLTRYCSERDERTSESHAHHADGHAHHAHIFSSDFVCALHIVSKSRAWVVNKFVLAHLFVAV